MSQIPTAHLNEPIRRLYPYRVNQVEVNLSVKGENITMMISGDCMPPDSIIRTAYKEVKNSRCNRYKHAAVIYKKKQIIASAFNVQRKSHPNGSGPYMTLHAEVRALNHALSKCDDLENARMFVLRTNNQQVIKTSKPCKDCWKYIQRIGVQVCWTDGINEEMDAESPLAIRLRQEYGYEEFQRAQGFYRTESVRKSHICKSVATDQGNRR